MSYSHQMDEVALAAAASLASAADIVTKVFMRPTQVMYAGLRVTTQATTTAPVVDVYWRPTQGSDTGRVLLKRLTRPLAEWTVGKWIWGKIDMSGNAIKPGGDLVFEVSTAAAAGAADCFALVSPSWENFDNLTAMVETSA